VLVGSNLPHVWQQDENSSGANRHVHAIIIRFLETFLGRDFLQVPEFAPIRSLLKRASRGLEVRGRTRERATAIILEMPKLKGMQRVARLLELLDLLAHSKELNPIASAGFAPTLDGGDEDRMKRVIQYINDRFTGRIDRQQVADCAHLSPGAFSRFFKLRTGKTLPQYVNELRVGRACRLLANEAAKVTDIAHECGFENLANFNRHFLKITGMPPRAYRERLRQTAA
jgi:AraC-like DNA-binding protein